jgi:hypothetical protein
VLNLDPFRVRAWFRRSNVWSRGLLGKDTAGSHETESPPNIERRSDGMSMGVVMDAAP